MSLGDKFAKGTTYCLNSLDFPECAQAIEESNAVSWVEINGLRYRPTTVIVTEVVNDVPLFWQIKHILVNEANTKFICTKLVTTGFDLHVKAFEVNISCNDVKLVEFKDICSKFPTTLYVSPGGKTFVLHSY